MEKEPKQMKIKDTVDDTEYSFTIENEGDKLHFKIVETDEKCPFIFENTFDLDDFIEKHKAFKQCDNVSEVEQHFYKLFDKGKLSIFDLGDPNEKNIQPKIGDISEEVDSFYFSLHKKYTYNDEGVLELYNIYKKDKKVKDKIKEIILNKIEKENPLRKDILNLLEENK